MIRMASLWLEHDKNSEPSFSFSYLLHRARVRECSVYSKRACLFKEADCGHVQKGTGISCAQEFKRRVDITCFERSGPKGKDALLRESRHLTTQLIFRQSIAQSTSCAYGPPQPREHHPVEFVESAKLAMVPSRALEEVISSLCPERLFHSG